MKITDKARRALFLCLLSAVACTTGDEITQADASAELAAFDRENPHCELWTNWQQMCSRTGPNGEVVCKEDPVTRAQPSSPFCVVDRVRSFDQIATYSKSQYESYLRFCDKKSDTAWASLRDTPEKVASCVSYQKERPFNGYHLEARRHPWCRSWRTIKGDVLLLQEEAGNPNRGTLDCARDDCSKTVLDDWLMCNQNRPDSWCTSAHWMYHWGSLPGQTRIDLPDDPERVVIAPSYVYLREDIPVLGVYCQSRR